MKYNFTSGATLPNNQISNLLPRVFPDRGGSDCGGDYAETMPGRFGTIGAVEMIEKNPKSDIVRVLSS